MIKENLHIVSPAMGLKKTLSLISDLEQLAIADPGFRQFVENKFRINCDCPKQIFQRIWKFIHQNFSYTSDQSLGGDEVITSPQKLLYTRRGDCDDFSLFIRSACKILNRQSNYVLAGAKVNEYTHIFVYAEGFILDGANEVFNDIPQRYNFLKILNI